MRRLVLTLALWMLACSPDGGNVTTDVGPDCQEGDCLVCLPDCEGRECGDDGCGGQCGGCFGDKVCIDGVCDYPCQSMCGMSECGDDGCGGSCGTCSGTTYCHDGLCVQACSPACEDKECGDDGCGGSCGECPSAAPLCQAGTCQADCAGGCDGKECGDDGCGGSCGECPEQHICLADGTCLCQPNCSDDACGDDGCGGSCGGCDGPQGSCQEGVCICTPACDGKSCGDDGCGDTCGTCPANHDCLESGECICVPSCDGKECGSDGCTGLCGDCACGENCTLDGQCLFTACADLECGSDGCGGVCGTCAEGAYCVAGICPPEGSTCFDDNDVDWDGCTDGDLSEFQVAEVTTEDQTEAAVSALPDGRFLIAWRSDEQDGNGPGVFARGFGADGLALGAPIQVNVETYGAQKRPAVASSGDGTMVVWESTGQDGFMEGIFARRLDGNGEPLGDEFQVNQFTDFSQQFPAVSALPDGWLILWQSPAKDGSGTAVVARRMALDGTPVDDEFVVNDTLLHDQGGPAAAVLSDGTALLAWNSFQQDGSNWGIAARRFSQTLAATGVEFIANTTTTNSQVWPTTTAITATDTVVLWQSLEQDGEGYGIYGQRFGPTYKLGVEFALNGESAGDQEAVSVAPLGNGGFAVAWQVCPVLGSPDEGPDGEGCAVVWRRFDAKAKPLGDEAVVNNYVAGDQLRPAVAMAGEAVVLVWESCPGILQEASQDGAGCGLYGRRFATTGKALYH